MIVCIRFFFVNLIFLSFLHSEELVRLDCSTELNSTWNIKGSPVRVGVKQEVSADLLLKKEGSKRFEFPVPFSLTLRDYRLEVKSGNEIIRNDLKNPGSFLALAELSKFQGRLIEFTLQKEPPYIQYPNDFSKKFNEILIFDQPVFEGTFIDVLSSLLSILDHPMKAGEGFQLTKEKSERSSFTSTTTFTVRESNEEVLVVDSTWLTQRQKTTLPGGQKGEEFPAVIYGEMKGVWTIRKKDPLLFTFEERGAVSYSLGMEELQASIVHEMVRKASTAPQ